MGSRKVSQGGHGSERNLASRALAARRAQAAPSPGPARPPPATSAMTVVLAASAPQPRSCSLCRELEVVSWGLGCNSGCRHLNLLLQAPRRPPPQLLLHGAAPAAAACQAQPRQQAAQRTAALGWLHICLRLLPLLLGELLQAAPAAGGGVGGKDAHPLACRKVGGDIDLATGGRSGHSRHADTACEYLAGPVMWSAGALADCGRAGGQYMQHACLPTAGGQLLLSLLLLPLLLLLLPAGTHAATLLAPTPAGSPGCVCCRGRRPR